MSDFSIRHATEADRLPLTEMWARVVEENVGLGTEPPVDREARAALWKIEGTLLAEADGDVIGSIHVQPSRHGYADIGMAVATRRLDHLNLLADDVIRRKEADQHP